MHDEPRPGPRPTTSDRGPHRQIDQKASPALWGELVAGTFSLPGVVEGHSQVSPADSRAVFFADQPVDDIARLGERIDAERDSRGCLTGSRRCCRDSARCSNSSPSTD